MKCWAHELGGCGGGQSREHLVSESLWTGPSIEVVGFAWCKKKPIQIGIANFTSKILCRVHNSRLSEVDKGGASAFRTLADAFQLLRARQQIANRPWMQQCYRIDGPPLERWFLKTTINLHLAQAKAPMWKTSRPSFTPPLELVRFAYGLDELNHPRGLYAAAVPGERTKHQEGVEFRPLFALDDSIVGGLFTFRGFRFLLAVAGTELPLRLSLDDDPADPWHRSELLHRIRRININIDSERSHFIEFTWPGKTSAHYTE